MRCFVNLSTRAKILFLIALVSVLLGCVGYTGYFYGTRIAANSRVMFSSRIQPIGWLFDSLVHGRAIQGDICALLLTVNAQENQALLADIQRRKKTVEENFSSLEKSLSGAEETERIARMRPLVGRFDAACEKTVRSAMANLNEQGYAQFTKDALPIFTEYQKEVRDFAEYERVSAKGLNTASERMPRRRST